MSVFRVFNRVVDVALVLALAVITVVLVVQVCMRYVFHAALPWPEELSQFLLVGISFLGMYRAITEDLHIRIDYLPKGPLTLRLLRAAGLVLVAGFLGYVGYGGLQLAISAWDHPSTALRIPMAIPYIIIPISCALSLAALFGAIRTILVAPPSGSDQP
jgi:TRAP-type transport system small permease protein